MLAGTGSQAEYGKLALLIFWSVLQLISTGLFSPYCWRAILEVDVGRIVTVEAGVTSRVERWGLYIHVHRDTTLMN